MSKNIEDRKKEIREKLVNDLFVEKYSTFKESVELINQAFDIFNINYQYTYDKFCQDFTDETMKYVDDNPNIDITGYKEMYLSTPLIVMSLINKIKNEHGFKKELLDKK